MSERRYVRYVQHWECDCGETISGPVGVADEWCADHMNSHDSPVTMRGRMTALSVGPPPLVRSLLAHPGGKADVRPGGTLGAGELDPGVEAVGLGSDGGDTLGDLVEGVLLFPGGDGGQGGSSADGFDSNVGEVHASTIDDGHALRQPRMTDRSNEHVPGWYCGNVGCSQVGPHEHASGVDAGGAH